MITLVDAGQAPERRARFLDAVRGRPYFGDLLPVELAVFGAMHGAPVPRFFTATPNAALCIRGRGAVLCGTYDVEETGGFLQLHGAEYVQTDGAPPAGYVRRQRLYCMAFSGAAELPMPPIAGLTLDKTPPPGETADFLMCVKGVKGEKGAKGEKNAKDVEIRDNFYSELCIKLARGAACVWAVRQAVDEAGNEAGDGPGKMIATAGAYALTDETAYLASIETAEPLRGRGAGAWLVGTFAAQLAGEGRRVALVCAENRVSFYERLGFRAENTIWRCAQETEV